MLSVFTLFVQVAHAAPIIAPQGSSSGKLNVVAAVHSLYGQILLVMTALAAALAVIYVIYGGVQYIMSAGNAEKAKAARSLIINVLLGVIIVTAAYTIIRFGIILGRQVAGQNSFIQPTASPDDDVDETLNPTKPEPNTVPIAIKMFNEAGNVISLSDFEVTIDGEKATSTTFTLKPQPASKHSVVMRKKNSDGTFTALCSKEGIIHPQNKNNLILGLTAVGEDCYADFSNVSSPVPIIVKVFQDNKAVDANTISIFEIDKRVLISKPLSITSSLSNIKLLPKADSKHDLQLGTCIKTDVLHKQGYDFLAIRTSGSSCTAEFTNKEPTTSSSTGTGTPITVWLLDANNQPITELASLKVDDVTVDYPSTRIAYLQAKTDSLHTAEILPPDDNPALFQSCDRQARHQSGNEVLVLWLTDNENEVCIGDFYPSLTSAKANASGNLTVLLQNEGEQIDNEEFTVGIDGVSDSITASGSFAINKLFQHHYITVTSNEEESNYGSCEQDFTYRPSFGTDVAINFDGYGSCTVEQVQ